MSEKYRADVDGLRAVAVLAVLAFHGFPAWMPGGFTGVDVFFVISGYLISGIIMGELRSGSFSFANFYARRIRRIFPALIVVMAALLVVGWFVLIPGEYRRLAKHTRAAAVFILNFTLWREAGYFDVAARMKPLLHLWSLAIEEQFYIVWPVLLSLAWRWLRGFTWLIVGGIVLSFAVNVVQVESHPESAFFLPLARFWELLLGALAAQLELGGKSRASAAVQNAKSVTGAVLVVAGIALLSEARAFPGWWALLPTVGTFLLISAGPDAWLNRAVLARRAMVGVGLVSYPLYLWHWPLLSLASIVLQRGVSAGVTLFLLALSGLLAWATYELVEKPIRFGRRRREAGQRDWRVWGLASSMVAVALGAVWIGTHKGIRERFPEMDAIRSQLGELRSQPVDPECKRFASLPDRAFEFCRLIPGTGPELVAIVGDSHARNLLRGVSEKVAARGQGVVLLASMGCPPLAGTTVGVTEAERTECTKGTQQILDLVVSKDEIQAVVLAMRGPLYLTGRGFGEVDRNDRTTTIAATAGGGDGQSPLSAYREGLRRTVETLGRTGRPVYYVLQVPELGFTPMSCFLRPAWVRPERACEVDRAEVDARQAEYRAMVLELARELPGLTVLDPLTLFCDGASCKARQGDTLLYEDDDHVSVDGGRLIATQLF